MSEFLLSKPHFHLSVYNDNNFVTITDGIELYRDPHGEKIFSSGGKNSSDDRHAHSFRSTVDWEHVDPLRKRVVELENQLSIMVRFPYIA